MLGTDLRHFEKIVRTVFFVMFVASPSLASGADLSELESSFKEFLGTYIAEIKQSNTDSLGTVHPKLPEESHQFFIDITLNMMRYADEEGLDPEITCREFKICKVTWPQPGDSWAAQTFIRHEGNWLWLEY